MYVVQTARTRMRPHALADVPFMVELNGDPEVVRYTGDSAFLHPDDATRVVRSLVEQFASRGLGRFIVEDRNGVRLGWCGLKWHDDEGAADLGFRFLRARWGQGFATETAGACLAYADGLGLQVFARAMPANRGSVRVLEKVGFHPVSWGGEDGFVRYVRVGSKA